MPCPELLRSSWIQIRVFSYTLCSRFKVEEVSHPCKRFELIFVLHRYIRKRYFYLSRILYRLLQNAYLEIHSSFFLLFSHGVRLSPLGTAATVWPIVPATDDGDDYAAVGGMRIGRGNRSTRRKTATLTTTNPK
jgi:hypothetical protein